MSVLLFDISIVIWYQYCYLISVLLFGISILQTSIYSFAVLLLANRETTIFILINALGALQFRSPENDVLKTKCGQIYQNFNVLMPFCMTFAHLFPIESGRGHLLE